MNEFIEKLIGRLGEINYTDYGSFGSYESHVAVRNCLRDVKNIVNQLAEEHNKDFCEWKIDGVYMRSPHDKVFVSCLDEETYRYNYCPVCGKRIKAVEPKGE